MSDYLQKDYPLPDVHDTDKLEDFIDGVTWDLHWKSGGGYSTDFSVIDSYSQTKFFKYTDEIEKAYYYEKQLRDSNTERNYPLTPDQFDTLRVAAFTYQMAAFMRSWAGSVRDEWNKIWSDQTNEIHNNTRDQRLADEKDMIQNLQTTMQASTHNSDEWTRAYLMYQHVMGHSQMLVKDDDEGRRHWVIARMFYDMYATAFMGE